MTRRWFFGTLAASCAAVLGKLGLSARSPRVSDLRAMKFYPPWLAGYSSGRTQVFLDGEDVSDRCTAAWEEPGLVELLLHDLDGHPYYDFLTDDVARELRRGKVEIRIREKPPKPKILPENRQRAICLAEGNIIRERLRLPLKRLI